MISIQSLIVFGLIEVVVLIFLLSSLHMVAFFQTQYLANNHNLCMR